MQNKKSRWVLLRSSDGLEEEELTSFERCSLSKNVLDFENTLSALPSVEDIF